MSKKLYVICNSHLDPVWIWRRRSGRTSWTNTMHSVVRSLERHPELKFTCSAAALYRWIEETEPLLFKKIGKLVEDGRWEIVGGWEVQADAIVSNAESLIRQGQIAKDYFRKKFGVEVKTGYSVDSFGHSAGLPKILRATGFENYVFLRPMDHQMKLPPLFTWKADDGSAVTALHIRDTYGAQFVSREWYMRRIEENVQNGLDKQTLFFGMGDHGGGISETQLGWLKEASEKYDIVFSTIAEYLEDCKDMEFPEITGELNQVHTGCYTACHEVKREIAIAMQRLTAAEKLGVAPEELEEPWREVLFNHFHDILPGTCIMEAYRNDVYPAIGSVISKANMLADRALCRRTSVENTMFMEQGGVYLRNTEPVSVTAPVSITGFVDPNETGRNFNALRDRDGNRIPLQLLQAPTMFGPCGVPWANLTAVVSLPPNGEIFLAYDAFGETQTETLGFDKQREFLSRLSFQLFYDDYGTWGFDLEQKGYFHVDDTSAEPVITEVADGAVASVLRGTYKIRSSEIQVDVTRYAGIKELKLNLRIQWNEKATCLKMSYDHGLQDFTFATGVSADYVERMKGTRKRGKLYPGTTGIPYYPNTRECVMHDWCAVRNESEAAAFFAQDIHGCDHADGLMRLTLLRAVPYADHHPFPRNEQTGYMEIGMSFMELWFSDDSELDFRNAQSKAQQRLIPLEELEVTAHEAGPDAIQPECPITLCNPNLVILSSHLLENGRWELHVMNYGDETVLELPERDVSLASNSLAILVV